MTLTPVHCPNEAEKCGYRTSQMSHNDVCPCCLGMEDILRYWNLDRNAKLQNKDVSQRFELLHEKIQTHEKIQDDHVHEIHQSGAIIVGCHPFDFVTVGGVLLPSDKE